MCSSKCSHLMYFYIICTIRSKNHGVAWEALRQCLVHTASRWSLSYCFCPNLCESLCFRWIQVQDLITWDPWLLPERHFQFCSHMVIDLKRPGEPPVEKRTKSRKIYGCHLSLTYFWGKHLYHCQCLQSRNSELKLLYAFESHECRSYNSTKVAGVHECGYRKFIQKWYEKALGC